RLMRAIGRADLAEDPRYALAPGRTADREPLENAIRAWIAAHDAAEALAVLERAEVPAATTTTIADIFQDPHYAAREAIATVEAPALGTIQMQGVTPRLSLAPGAVRRGGPLLGEHNAEVYGDLLGLPAAQIGALHDAGVI